MSAFGIRPLSTKAVGLSEIQSQHPRRVENRLPLHSSAMSLRPDHACCVQSHSSAQEVGPLVAGWYVTSG
jgi:hypothetical protein